MKLTTPESLEPEESLALLENYIDDFFDPRVMGKKA